MSKTLMGLSVVVVVSLSLGANPAVAFGTKRPSPEEFRSTCERMRTQGLPEWRQVDWSRIARSTPAEANLHYEAPIVFHVINHKGGLSGGFKITEGEINTHLESLRTAFNACGVAIVPQEIHYWDAPKWLGTVDRAANTHNLSDEERCLFRGVHRDGRVNVYFVEGVAGADGRSHAHADYWFEPVEEDDARFVGSALIADMDREGYGQTVSTRYTVVPHEVGHVLMNVSHTMGGGYNLMSDSANQLALILTPEQCEKAREGRFTRVR